MQMTGKLIAGIFAIMLLASCGSAASGGSSSNTSYKETKSMVLDILKSEDGIKALQEGSSKGSDGGMKLLASEEGMKIQQTVKDVLTSSDGSKIIEKTFTDPKFASQFAKAIQEENKQIQSDLLKDPNYQKALLQLMHDPEYTKVVENVLKGQQFRLTMMDVMKESLQSPLFRAQMIELMTKAIAEETKPKQADELKATESGDKEQKKGKEKKDESDDEGSSQGKESGEGGSSGGGGSGS